MDLRQRDLVSDREPAADRPLFTATIGFDLSALHAEYGSATEPGNADRIDRLFRHEYAHLMQKSWLAAHPYSPRSPLEHALFDIWLEGLGTWHSLSEPWRATAFPVIKDLIVDRTAFDRIVAAGGYISVRTGAAPDANAIPVPKENADLAFDAAECIQCGACVAACPNASAMLFTAAKVAHLNLLPQGQPERDRRTRGMVAQMNAEHFGHCTNHGACENACPKGISLDFIAMLNRDLMRARVGSR